MNLKNLTPLALSVSIAIGGLAIAPAASAEVSANVAISNMYLWRGMNLANTGGTVSGGIDYANESGVYAGVWTSSESGGTETDLYFGFAGEAGDISYDVGYIWYLYPEDTGFSADLGDNDFSEIMLSAGMAGFGAAIYISADPLPVSATVDGEDYTYIALDYTTGDYNILYGIQSMDKTSSADYTHLTLTYSYSESLSFAVSIASPDTTDAMEEDPLFAVTYSIPLAK